MNQIKFFFLTLIFILYGWSPAYSAPQLDIHCAIVKGSLHYGYCIHRPAKSDNQDVLYYLHSKGASEYEWQYSKEISKLYEAWGTHAPTVITVSYGSTWLLAEKNESKRSGLLEHFSEQVIPYLEKKLDFIPQHRLLVGASMGGFNASQLYLKRPNLFSRVALLCPAFSDLSPYDKTTDVEDYIRRTHADAESVKQALYLTSLYFPDQNSWQKAAPITLASQVVNPYYPKIFVSIGSNDRFGFFEGAKAFTRAVQQRGGNVQNIWVSGDHCSFDVLGGISFISQPF